MAISNPTDPLRRAAETLSTGVHVTYDLWEQVKHDERFRGVAFFARRTLDALDFDNQRAADEAPSKMDDARALIGGER